MAQRRANKTLVADQALELMMRDALEGLEEFAAHFGFRPWPGDFEVICLETPKEADRPRRRRVLTH